MNTPALHESTQPGNNSTALSIPANPVWPAACADHELGSLLLKEAFTDRETVRSMSAHDPPLKDPNHA